MLLHAIPMAFCILAAKAVAIAIRNLCRTYAILALAVDRYEAFEWQL